MGLVTLLFVVRDAAIPGTAATVGTQILSGRALTMDQTKAAHLIVSAVALHNLCIRARVPLQSEFHRDQVALAYSHHPAGYHPHPPLHSNAVASTQQRDLYIAAHFE